MNSDRLSHLTFVVALAAALGAASCVTMQVPERFLVTDRGVSELKAITPDETKLWVRDFTDDHQADLAFWREALVRDLVENRGYTLVEEGRATDAGGNEGVELLLEATIQGRAMRELMVVFVYPGTFSNRVRVVEVVGEKEPFEALLSDARAAVRTLQP
jgi:hypothetical protein